MKRTNFNPMSAFLHISARQAERLASGRKESSPDEYSAPTGDPKLREARNAIEDKRNTAPEPGSADWYFST